MLIFKDISIKKSVLRIALLALSALALVLSLSSFGALKDKTIKIGWIPWDEDIAVNYLWEHILTEKGYNVELLMAYAGPIFEGVSSGDIDLFIDAWSPVTHADYIKRYKGEFKELGTWYDQATLNWTVPAYLEGIDSIEDLKENADLFGGRIISIEPGAGITRLSQEEVIPAYDLESMDFVTGSTVAMLAELRSAIEDQKPIAVTLWHPHWAYSSFDLKDLEDPQGALGEAEELKVISVLGFNEEYPEVARWMSNFNMNDEQLAELEEIVINQYGVGDEDLGVSKWPEDPENKALVDSWLS